MKRILFLLIAIPFLAGWSSENQPVNSKWTQIKSCNGWIDTNNIQKHTYNKRPFAQTWFKTERTAQENERIDLIRVDCRGSKMAVITIQEYSKNENLIRPTTSDSAKYEAIDPSSCKARIHNRICPRQM
jgi:hypothetical protein